LDNPKRRRNKMTLLQACIREEGNEEAGRSLYESVVTNCKDVIESGGSYRDVAEALRSDGFDADYMSDVIEYCAGC
jgi:hypothetical protein